MLHVAVVSDTHCSGDGSLPQPLLDAIRGVDLILHCGDLECIGVLDCLETVAPVLAVRGYEDPTEPGERLADRTRVVDLDGLRVGMVHDINWPGPMVDIDRDACKLVFRSAPPRESVRRKFGEEVSAVLYGDSHFPLTETHDGILFFNSGSPTVPGIRHGEMLPVTFGLLRVERKIMTVELKTF